MADYNAHFARHLRLVILRLLAEMPEYKLNDSVLTDAANMHGLVASRSLVRTEIGWLAENGLVTRDEPAPGLVVATLTERGADVAAGRATVDGVQRPSPKG